MGLIAPGEQQKKRFRKWQNLAPPQTRFFSSAVDAQLLPPLQAIGFFRVDVDLKDSDSPVRGSDIRLERWTSQFVDSIDFSFEKYRTPRVQIYFSRRISSPPYEFVRHGKLVASNKQYYYFWGKPWWLPTRFWSEKLSQKTVGELAVLMTQITPYLECGMRGANISKSTDGLIWPKPNTSSP